MSEHTPGPWKYYVQRTCDGYETHTVDTEAKVSPYEGNRVCSCGGMKEKDGHLIAAAPELLEAAEIIEDRIAYYASLYEEDAPNIEEWGYTDNSGDMAKLRQAIAKAKGEQE